MKNKSVFETLSVIDVSAYTKKKGRFNYVSWVFAWTEVKKKYPDMNSTVYENADGWNYHHDGKTAWVKVGVTIGELEHIEYYPVTNNSNQAIALEKLNSFDVNTAIQRAVTKSIARFGCGLNVYAGEDLPLSEDDFLTDEELQAKADVEAEEQAKKQDLINNYIHKIDANCAQEETGEVKTLLNEVIEAGIRSDVWSGVNQPTKDFINAMGAKKVA
jgi:hypothetical protein